MIESFSIAIKRTVDSSLRDKNPNFIEKYVGFLRSISAALDDSDRVQNEDQSDLIDELMSFKDELNFKSEADKQDAIKLIQNLGDFEPRMFAQTIDAALNYTHLAAWFIEFGSTLGGLEDILEGRLTDLPESVVGIKESLANGAAQILSATNSEGRIDPNLVWDNDGSCILNKYWDPLSPAQKFGADWVPVMIMFATLSDEQIPISDYINVVLNFFPDSSLKSLRPDDGQRTTDISDGPSEPKNTSIGTIQDLLVVPLINVVNDAADGKLDDTQLECLDQVLTFIYYTSASRNLEELKNYLDSMWSEFSVADTPPFFENLNTEAARNQLIAGLRDADVLGKLQKIEAYKSVPETAVLTNYLSGQMGIIQDLPAGPVKFERIQAFMMQVGQFLEISDLSDDAEIEDAVHALKLPDAVTTALLEASHFMSRWIEVTGSPLRTMADTAQRLDDRMLKTLQDDAFAQLSKDVNARRLACDVQTLQDFESRLTLLNPADPEKFTLQIQDISKVWPAFAQAKNSWATLQLYNQGNSYIKACLSRVVKTIQQALFVLKEIAPYIVACYRHIDDAMLSGDADNVLNRSEKDEFEIYLGPRGETKQTRREAVRTSGINFAQTDFAQSADDDALFDILDAELVKLAKYHTHFADIMMGIKVVSDTSETLRSSTESILGNYGDSVSEGRFSDPEKTREVLGMLATTTNRFVDFQDRLTRLTGKPGSTIGGILKDAVDWNFTDYTLSWDQKAHFDKRWSSVAPAMQGIFDARLSKAAWVRFTRHDLGSALRYFCFETVAKDHATLCVPLARKMIDVLQEDLRERMEEHSFEDQWFSTSARNWAGLYPTKIEENPYSQTAEVFEGILASWHADEDDVTTKLNDAFNLNLPSLPGYVLAVFATQDRYTISFLIERLPSLIAQMNGAAEIEREAPGFLEGHILDFQLQDEVGAAQLSSIAPQDLLLELINKSEDTLILDDPVVHDSVSDLPNASDMACHFVLRFRHGALQDDLENIGLEGPDGDWEIVGRLTLPRKNPDYDALLIKGPKGHKIHVGQSRHLVLTQMQGAARGTRTTRVLLLHQGLKGPDHAIDPGHREHLLTIANAMPNSKGAASELPIHVGFADSNTVLNDGRHDNTLEIDLTSIVENERKPQVRFWNIGRASLYKVAVDKDFWLRSRIVVSFETQDDLIEDQKHWALCNKTQAFGIGVSMGLEDPDIDTSRTTWVSSFAGQGNNAEWVLTPPLIADQSDLVLKRGDALRLRLTNIRTQMANGPTSINLRCECFPGFPDRSYTLQVLKGPAVQRDRKLGIGKAEPVETLDVAGGAIFDGPVAANGVSHATIPAGVVMAFAGSEYTQHYDDRLKKWVDVFSLPDGWLLCDGKEIPKDDTYKALRAMMKDGRTPNLVGRTIVGAGDGAIGNDSELEKAKADTSVFGTTAEKFRLNTNERGGQTTVNLLRRNIPQHQHELRESAKDETMGYVRAPGYKGGHPSDFDRYHKDEDDAVIPVNTMPPFLGLCYIIKY